MDEDTRKLISRIQSEDLAALWNASTNDSSEIGATLRVYRRQLSLLDRHLDGTQQLRTVEDTGQAFDHDKVKSALEPTDTDAPFSNEHDDVHQDEGLHSRQKTSSLFAPTTSTRPATIVTASNPLPQGSDRLVVRLPSSVPMAREQVDKCDM